MMFRLGCVSRKSSIRGFTLIELLVAMVITAMIGAMSFASVSTARRSIEVMDERAQRMNELNGFFLRFTKDIEHIVPRSGMVNGQEAQALMYQSIEEGLSFTNSAKMNPGLFPRSNLQRVNYRLEDGNLLRTSWDRINGPAASKGKEFTLLNDVTDLKIRFVAPVKLSNISGRAPSLRWVNEWPVVRRQGNQGESVDQGNPLDALPMALEISLKLEPWGDITRVFEVNYES
ncbi:MAG: type II secretion system minor pseudopilin GspJ [Pseudomonadota bacterium]